MERYKHGGQIYDKAVSFDFSANVNPLGLPEKVRRVLEKTLEYSCFYPDDTCRALKEAIAMKEQVNKDYVICGNGASDLIYRIVHAKQPKHAMVLAPTFSEYEKALESVGCHINYECLVEENGFQLTDNILGSINENLDIMFLCNPNNPIGNVIEIELLEKIVEKAKQNNIFLVMDECFLDFVEDGERFSAKKYMIESKEIFILKAFTKIYAMAGIRLGYGMCSDVDFLEKMAMHGPSWSVSTLAQIAGVEALKQKKYVQKSLELVKEERTFLCKQLNKLGYKVYPTKANFIFFQGEESLYEEMLKREILIRPCDNYIGLSKKYYRIAVRTHEENLELIKALNECKIGKE